MKNRPRNHKNQEMMKNVAGLNRYRNHMIYTRMDWWDLLFLFGVQIELFKIIFH
jgi:hypothetical protein